MTRYENTFDMVGRTPHVRVRSHRVPDARLHVKLEGWNPTGSVKDRAGLRMIREAQESGALRPGMTLLDASSGNMACALAYFGRLLGHPTTLVVSSKLTQDKRSFLRYYGAMLHQVGDFTIEGNRFCRELVEREEPGRYCFFDQLHNWANPRAHYETTGPEILADFPEVEVVVGSLGSGGTLYGTALYLKERRPEVRVVAVQAAAGTKIPGTGSFDDGDYVTPFIRRGFDDGLFDRVVRVSEADAVGGTLLLRDQGVFAGIQTGGVLHAAETAARDLGATGDVVFISGDSGWKNVDKLLPHAPPAAATP
ncbi:MAG TPA: cysteine synthase family protein [Longimicrobiaceae bacterium]|nr:cysteine synthase family protein [Longimicrobiaceae bacterium]